MVKSWDSIDQSPLLLRGSSQYWCPSRQGAEKIIEVLHLLESILRAACCPVRICLYLKWHHSPIEANNTHRLFKKINKTTNTIFNLFPSWILKGKSNKKPSVFRNTSKQLCTTNWKKSPRMKTLCRFLINTPWFQNDACPEDQEKNLIYLLNSFKN